MFITFLHPQAKADLCKDTTPGAQTAFFRQIKWKFMRVQHLYTHYVPPKEVVELLVSKENLPPDVQEAYNKFAAEVAQAPLMPVTPGPSTPTGPRLNRPSNSVLAAASPATSSTAAPSQSSAHSASALSTPTRQLQSTNSGTSPLAPSQENLPEQIAVLRDRLKEVERKVVDVASASSSNSSSNPPPRSKVLEDAEEHYEKERSKRKRAEANVKDLEEALHEKERKLDAARQSRRDRQRAEAGVLMDDVEIKRVALKERIAARQKELAERSWARSKLEQEIRELNVERSGADLQVSALAGETTMVSLYVQAFDALRVAGSGAAQAS